MGSFDPVIYIQKSVNLGIITAIKICIQRYFLKYNK